MIREDNYEDVENPMQEVDVLLSSCAWVLRSTARIITVKTPVQLIHKKDMTMQVEIDMSWSEALRKK